MSVIAANLNTYSQNVYSAPVKAYIPRKASTGQTSTRTLNLRLDVSKSIASDGAFKAAMQRILVEKKIWEDFLEKLRQSGGGGGGSLRRIDRIAVSFMLMNFLSDKTMKALMQNFNIEFLKQLAFSNDKSTQNPVVNFISQATFLIAHTVASIVASVVNSPVVQNIGNMISTVVKGVSSLAVYFSFQLNKLKELLEKELNEAIRKLDLKEKLQKLKEIVADFFVELKEETFNFIEFVKAKFKSYFLLKFVSQ
ncbi:MAG: hypothetical protein HYR97_05795 [Candidatus Melainabacteria bacterium]|nr:hypothetical protein [Candidatus Melainabacteria bacterium]MBI3308896.1 hypothetical protein [Candidatus Melainabacteria bacterium]